MIKVNATNSQSRNSRLAKRSRRRASGLLRGIVVGLATLAILLVCFSIYQFSQIDPRAANSKQTTRLPELPLKIPGQTQATEDDGVPVSGGRVGTALRSKLSLFRPDSDRAWGEVEVGRLTPVAGEGNEIALENPVIRLRTQDGHGVRITAKEAIVEGQISHGLTPMRGKLFGGVVIEYDRLSEQQRDSLPEDTRHILEPSQVVRIEANEIIFDVEYSKVIFPSDVAILASDITFRSANMEIRFDESAGRVDYLRIESGGTIELKGQASSLGIAAGQEAQPGNSVVDWIRQTIASNILAAQQQVANGGIQEEIKESPTEETVPLFSATDNPAEVEVSKPTLKYIARFAGGVDARQVAGGKTLARLEAGTLDILRSVSANDRKQVQSQTNMEQTAAQKVAGATEEKISLSWEGHFSLEACGKNDERCLPKVRSLLTAKGSPVRLSNDEGEATCGQLVYNPDDGSVTLSESKNTNVVVRSLADGEISGTSIDLKPGEDDIAILVKGPGKLMRIDHSQSASVTGQSKTPGRTPLSVAFSDSLEVLGHYEKRTKLSFSGGLRQTRVRVLDKAIFLGNVALIEQDASLAADQLALYFGKETVGRQQAQTIQRVETRGHVRLDRLNDSLACSELDVIVTTNADGRLMPLVATARRDVVAMQEDRTIRARDRLILDFQTVTRPASPFDPAKAYQAALDAGVNPQEVDWEAKRREHEMKVRTEIGAKRLRAYGDVMVTDESQSLELTAQELDCTIVNGSDIDKTLIIGTQTQPASVTTGEFTVTGEQVNVNVLDEWAQVPGAGRMTFQSHKDLDGRQLDQPIPVSITWEEWMKFQGRENRSVFSGDVHATSAGGTTFDCNQLVVEFDDVAIAKTQPQRRNWWIFDKFVQRFEQNNNGEMSANRGILAKEPAYILATGRAVVQTTSLDEITGEPRTRARLAGPQLSVNLRRGMSKMLIEGAGDLLIEDFSPARQSSSQQAETTPRGFLGADENSGPSKTFITWSQAMWYDFSIDQTRFEGDINLKHFSGEHLTRLFPDAKKTTTETGSGRATFLLCDVLTIDFLGEQSASTRPQQQMGRLSTTQLRQFHASGQVRLQDQTEGLSLTASDLTFERERELLIIQGQPARIIQQRPGQLPVDATVKRAFYNLRTKRLESEQAIIRGR